MWTKLESMSNFAIGHAAGDVLYDLSLAGREQFDAFVVGGADARRVGKRFECLIEVVATSPDLPFMDGADTFAETLQALLFGKNASSARPESTPVLLVAWRNPAE